MTDVLAFYNNERRADPTRTLTLRERWVTDWNARIAALKKVIKKSVVDNDGFGLKQENRFLQVQAAPPLTPATTGQWAYRWSHEKVAGFMGWLREMEERSLLEIVQRDVLRPGGEPWSNIHVRSAYQRGLAYALDNIRKESASLARDLGISDIDLPPAFRSTGGAISALMNQPFHADRLALAYTRVFDELKGVTSAMDQQISRVLTNGLAQGLNPRQIGDLIADRVEKIGGTRGRLIARTETINVHQQAALNEYYASEQATGEVFLVEWNATLDSRTRDTHMERHERVYTKEEAYALIGEPNCRCALLPYIPSVQGIPKKATQAAKAAAEKAVAQSEKREEAKTSKKPEVKKPKEKLGAFSSLSTAKEWAQKKYPNTIWDFEGTHIDTINPTLKQFDKLAKDFPKVAERIKYVGTYEGSEFPDNFNIWGFKKNENHWAHAHHDGTALGINPKWYSDKVKFEESMQKCVFNGWHPEGCNTIESILTHEFGHCVEAYYRRDNLMAYSEAVRASGVGLYNDTVSLFMEYNKAPVVLSQYATTNDSEGWAEGFSAIYHSPPTTTKYSYVQRLKRLLDFFKDKPELGREDWTWFRDASEEDRKKINDIKEFFVKKLGFKDVL